MSQLHSSNGKAREITMKTSSISKLNGYASALLSLSLLALAAPGCVGDASEEGEPGALAGDDPTGSAELGLTEVAVKPVPVRPATLPGVATGEDLPVKPAYSARSREASSLLNWTTTLSASPTSLWPTQFSTLTATANADVGPTPFFLRIRESWGPVIASCGAGTVCSIPVTNPYGYSKSYTASVEDLSGNVQSSSSSTASVDWYYTEVNLSASSTTLSVGATSTLTATTNRDIGPSPFVTLIFDVTTGTLLQGCGFGTSCSVTVSQADASTHAYQAFVGPSSATFPPPAAQDASATSYVTWANTGLSISLSNPVGGGFSQTVTATASINVSDTPYFIEIFNESTGAQIANCSSNSTCTVTYQGNSTIMPLVAFLATSSTKTLPPVGVHASSNVVYSTGVIGLSK